MGVATDPRLEIGFDAGAQDARIRAHHPLNVGDPHATQKAHDGQHLAIDLVQNQPWHLPDQRTDLCGLDAHLRSTRTYIGQFTYTKHIGVKTGQSELSASIID